MTTLTRTNSANEAGGVGINARWIAVGLFFLTIVLRLPFVSQYMYHWDSVNMAFGIREFDVLDGAPQFPGYIVYIALAQAINFVTGDEQTTMLLISIVSSGLAVVAMFYLGRDMFNPVVGLIGAFFLMTSPLVWFYSEIALPHAMDLFVVTLSVWLLYRLLQGDTRLFWFTAIFLALVGGFRQQNLLFLGPLILFVLWPLGLGRIIAFAAAGFVTTLLWFVPLMHFAGGLETYLAGSSAFSASFWDTTSLLHGAGIVGLRRNLIKLIPYTAFAWGAAALPALYWLTQVRGLGRWLRSRQAWFMILWMGPTLAFYIIIHMGQQGLVFVFLPALILISAAGLYRLFAARPAVLRGSAAAITLVNAAIFVLLPAYPLGESGPKLLTYSTIREQDQLIAGQIATVRSNFDPTNTLLVAAGWRFTEYYLPEYALARFDVGARWEVTEGQALGAQYADQPVTAAELDLEDGAGWQVVLMDAGLSEFARVPLEQATGPDGFTLDYYQLGAGDPYWTDGVSIGGE